MTRSLVIGGNGFIGSHLADKLTSMGRDVTVFDRFSHGIQNYNSRNVRQRVGDFLNVDDLRNAVKGQDEVFHFLSVTTPATAHSDPLLDIRVNTGQSVELFSACASAGVGMLYFASTGGAIYGENSAPKVSEHNPTSPKSPYAISKLSLEHYLEYFRLTRDLDYRIFRISNPYGPRQNPIKPQGLIPIVLRQILEGNPIQKFGDGSMIRDYIYVSDLVDMISTTLNVPSNHRVYNVGSGVGKSINEVLATVRQVTGSDLSIEYRPSPPTYVRRVVLDTTRFHSDFGAFQAISLDEGVARTWQSIRESAKAR
ncbi:NAD-dependent epimerase/dehydratase family protein [Arthrobacter oryzae]|uniref:NAD-dependent epimerase/dehydratase family protein n=1 Tax=Arthrobacter oryzae TaxID=409290 RepID=UPI00273BD0BB|nr:NAD-dependent epimerase/dehydratase family protein [Arthrobacter oryzae]WLQ07121.1 NAD-dependent epimerase/dehydratase family protein [Arthrobacter oryzae]